MDIRDRIVGLQRVKASQLVPNARNWRTHPEFQKDALKGVLAEIGFAAPLIARKREDGKLVLIDGHLRAETVPDMQVPVVVLDVTEEEADKLLLTLDPMAALAGRDDKNLKALLDEVEFQSQAVKKMLEGLGGPEMQELPPAGHTDPDDVPEPPKESWVKPGDLFALANHRLLCGDSTKLEDVDRLMAGAQADMCWTDPPYGVSYTGKTKEALTIQNDGAEGLEALLNGALQQAFRALRPGAAFYVSHPPGPAAITFGVSLLAAGFQVRQILVWVKNAMVLGHSDYHGRHEPIYYGYKPQPAGNGRLGRGGVGWFGDNAETTVMEIPKPSRSESHPTMKPVELVTRCLKNSSKALDLVFEPFSGSGTTILASEQTVRRCYAMELEPRYVQVAIERWEAFTGMKAKKL